MGWQPQVTFKQGLADTIQWYQDNDAWLQRVISGEYQDYMKEQYHERCCISGWNRVPSFSINQGHQQTFIASGQSAHDFLSSQ